MYGSFKPTPYTRLGKIIKLSRETARSWQPNDVDKKYVRYISMIRLYPYQDKH